MARIPPTLRNALLLAQGLAVAGAAVAGCSEDRGLDFGWELEPGALSVAAGATSLAISWSAVPGAREYAVRLTKEAGAVVGTAQVFVSEAQSLEVTGLEGGALYRVEVLARTRVGVGPLSQPVHGTALRKPLPGFGPFFQARGVIHGLKSGAFVGEEISNLGDIDGDGRIELGVFDARDDGTLEIHRGLVDAAVSTTANWALTGTLTGTAWGEGFGRRSAGGDVDGDGYSDVVLSAMNFEEPLGILTDAGAVLFFPGSATGPSMEPTWYYAGGSNNEYFGFAVAVGDVGGDSRADVVASTLANDRTHVFPGTAVGPGSPVWSESGPGPSSFGERISIADVTGDDRPDLLISASAYSGAYSLQGARFIYAGSNGAPAPATVPEILSVDSTNAQFGRDLGIGDVSGDGRPDVVGRKKVPPEFVVWVAGSNGLPAAPQWRFPDELGPGGVPGALAVCDLQGDGVEELVYGVPDYSVQIPNGGRVHVLAGIASTARSIVWSAEGLLANEAFGSNCVCLDTNGDGADELFVGSPFWNSSVGQVSVFTRYPSRGPVTSLGPPMKAVAGEPAIVPASFMDGEAAHHSCRWSWGDGTQTVTAPDQNCDSATASSVPHTWTEPGRYVVRLRVTNGYEYYGEAFTTVEVE